MKTKQTRMVLCARDMMNITGKSKNTVWRMTRAMKKQFNKKAASFITVKEFCEYTGLDEEKVMAAIQ